MSASRLKTIKCPLSAFPTFLPSTTKTKQRHWLVGVARCDVADSVAEGLARICRIFCR
jgi:hypothetical protein